MSQYAPKLEITVGHAVSGAFADPYNVRIHATSL